MKLNRIMVAAPGSGSGKTMMTCAILQVLKQRGIRVGSCKCGPDYIDPMFHETILNVPSGNLDTFFTDEALTRSLLLDGRTEDEFLVIEGVMGLYDGLGGVYEQGSSYHLAKVTKTPIVLVVDAKGMGRSLIAHIAGFLHYDRDQLIQGVILNRITKSYYETIKPLIEAELEVEVLGYCPTLREVRVASRYLGLLMPTELDGIRRNIEQVAAELEQRVDFDRLMEIAAHTEGITADPVFPPELSDDKPIIAVARDSAFCFFYQENLNLLERMGAEIRFFSPLKDDKLPDGCAALILGGGYPELFAEELSGNDIMRREIRNAFFNKMPILAEGGGFMYLHESIMDENGTTHQMVGAIKGTCQYKGRAVRFGYIDVKVKESSFLSKNSVIKGHEFHYYDSTNNGEDCIAVKPATGKEYECMISSDHTWLGFPHLYYPSNPEFVRHFVNLVKKYRDTLQ